MTVANLLAHEVDWENLKPIVCFVVLWNRLEDRHHGHITLPRLELSSRRAAGSKGFEVSRYMPHVEFFQRRYTDDPSRLERLFRLDNRRELAFEEKVRQLLRGEELTPEKTLEAIVVIPYRIRNNLFHGRKNPHELYGQTELFNHVNEILCLLHSDF